jgi:hypothetical protein
MPFFLRQARGTVANQMPCPSSARIQAGLLTSLKPYAMTPGGQGCFGGEVEQLDEDPNQVFGFITAGANPPMEIAAKPPVLPLTSLGR